MRLSLHHLSNSEHSGGNVINIEQLVDRINQNV